MSNITLLEAGKSTYKGITGRIYLARCNNCGMVQVKSSENDDKVFCVNCRDTWRCGAILSDLEIDKEIEKKNKDLSESHDYYWE